MKKFVIVFFLIALLFVLIASCQIDSTTENLEEPVDIEEPIENSEDPAGTIGASGMTFDEIKTIVVTLENTHNDLVYWLSTGSQYDFDDSLSPIPGDDGWTQFNWRAVKKYQTLDELYSAFEEIYSPEYAKKEFDEWGTEQLGVRDNEDSTGWDKHYYSYFKEIDGRLYRRDDEFYDYPSESSNNFDTLEIKEETVDRIVAVVYLKRDLVKTTPFKAEFALVNGRWVFDSYPWSA